jgi:hypothetical protein
MNSEVKYVAASGWTVTVGGVKYPPSSPTKPIFIKGMSDDVRQRLLDERKIKEYVLPDNSGETGAKAKVAALEQQVAELGLLNASLTRQLEEETAKREAAEKALNPKPPGDKPKP